MTDTCNFYWGSHGCDLSPEHEGVHHCGGTSLEDSCSEYDETTGGARYQLADVFEDGTEANFEWGEWHDHGRGFRI